MYFYFLYIQIDKEKYLLLAYNWHYRTMTGSGILDHYGNPGDINISDISTEYLSSVQSCETCSLSVQEIFHNLSELELKKKSDCQVKSVYRPSSSEVSVDVDMWFTKLLEY